ncbi:MAG: hypothetical protein JRJ65_05575, partial [Deltaproteobacteria bacterium]|nr:hypothetical protein [Deltaproteobacteria bacterium]
MNEWSSWKRRKTVEVKLLAVFVLAIGLLGCKTSSKETSPEDLDAFITDRVVKIHIVMKEEDWIACQKNALTEQYVRADFWFDGELIPDIGVRPKG